MRSHAVCVTVGITGLRSALPLKSKRPITKVFLTVLGQAKVCAHNNLANFPLSQKLLVFNLNAIFFLQDAPKIIMIVTKCKCERC